jgi:polyisoprenyl-phosphate glycosyltransferase
MKPTARSRKADPKISIVVPLYNEEANIEALHRRLLRLMRGMRLPIEAVLVDDGSTDSTPVRLEEIAAADRRFTAVMLSRNFGHQPALTAGLDHAAGTEAVFILDGDLQDPPEMLSVFLDTLRRGYDVVYGIRKLRKEPALKRLSYALFYRLFKKIAYTGLPLDSGDYGLISRRVVDILKRMPEENRFLRGMRSWVGFRQTGIPYERGRRNAGETKYSFRDMVRLAVTGIFSFSELPVRFMAVMGSVIIGLSSLYFVYTLVRKLAYHDVPRGFTMLFFTILLFSGMQFLSMGILGEYLLRVFFQVKGRPPYLVSKVVRRSGGRSHG